MISEKMKPYVKNNSAIRMMFEEGNRLRAKYGADKVFDFSLGNPSVPAPDSVREAIIELVNTTDPTVLHGYMSNAGFDHRRIPQQTFRYEIFRKESDHDRRCCKRTECDPENNPESWRRGDRFCAIFSGIRCICPQL